MNDLTNWHAALGELAITYSAVEHNLRRIVASLIEEGSGYLAGPIVVDRFPLSQTIRHGKTYLEFRFREDKSLQLRLLTLFNRVDEVRLTRSLFIHGLWLTEFPTSGGIRCLDFKLKKNKADDLWEYSHPYTFSINDLEQKLREAKEIQAETANLYKAVHDHFESART